MQSKSVKSIKRFPLTTGLAITFCIFYMTVGYCVTAFSSETLPNSLENTIKVYSLDSHESPVRIKGKIISAGDEQGGLLFTYSATNVAAKDVRSFLVAIYVIGKREHVKGGQAWRVFSDLSSGATVNFSMPISHQLNQGDRIEVTLKEAEFDNKIWEADTLPQVKNAKAQAVNNLLEALQPVAYRPFTCGADFCVKQSQIASKMCNGPTGCGLESFECNQTDCTVSWGCHACDMQ